MRPASRRWRPPTSGWRCARGVQWASARLMRSAIVIGTYDEVAETLRAFAENHGTDELMLISYIDDVEVKLAQYGELAARLAG